MVVVGLSRCLYFVRASEDQLFLAGTEVGGEDREDL
jgi:hypothetical protein